MSVESVISVPIDDTQFKRFTAQFDKYQKEVAKSAGMWKQAGTYQDAFGSKFAKVTMGLAVSSWRSSSGGGHSATASATGPRMIRPS